MAFGANMTKREQTLGGIGLAALALAFAYWYFLYRPKSTELRAAAVHVDSLDRANQRARAAIAQGSVQRLTQQAKQYQLSLSVMRGLVPRSNEVPALLEDISTAARRVGLDLSAVEPLPVIPGEQFDTYRYKLAVVGGYHAIGQFLSNVGSLNRIIAPVTLQADPHPIADRTKARVKKGESLIDTKFIVQTYVARTIPLPAPEGRR
jgi:type IV pilus assembly protein PilO